MKLSANFTKLIFACAFLVGVWVPSYASGEDLTYNWQKFKTPFEASVIQSGIAPTCMPIDPATTVDPNFCYVLQRQCWFDPSGYGTCYVRHCKYGEQLNGELTNAVGTGKWYWYCDGNPPPADCGTLGTIWKDRIVRDPSCQPHK
jgi:hypothetical protein